MRGFERRFGCLGELECAQCIDKLLVFAFLGVARFRGRKPRSRQGGRVLVRFRWLRIVGDPDDLVVFVISGVVFEIQVHGFFLRGGKW